MRRIPIAHRRGGNFVRHGMQYLLVMGTEGFFLRQGHTLRVNAGDLSPAGRLHRGNGSKLGHLRPYRLSRRNGVLHLFRQSVQGIKTGKPPAPPVTRPHLPANRYPFPQGFDAPIPQNHICTLNGFQPNTQKIHLSLVPRQGVGEQGAIVR